MENFSRTVTIAGGHDHFKFHPQCKGLKLNHLCFADDLMLFSKGDTTFVQILRDYIDSFAASSSLHANASVLIVVDCLFCLGLSLGRLMLSVGPTFGMWTIATQLLGIFIRMMSVLQTKLEA